MVYVLYGTTTLRTEWMPDDAAIVLVHNDDRFDGPLTGRPGVVELRGHGNVGFGAGANLALPELSGTRVIFVNPDTVLDPAHWNALTQAAPHELVSVPLLDSSNQLTVIASPYPSALALLLTAYRVGRILQRGSRLRRYAEWLLGRWGREHAESGGPMTRSLDEVWCSAAVMSVDLERLRQVDGFDPGYFLYFEDVDLCRRLADRFPDMSVRVAEVTPGFHGVGGSVTDRRGQRLVDVHRVRSALRYAEHQRGFAWALTRMLLRGRRAVLERI